LLVDISEEFVGAPAANDKVAARSRLDMVVASLGLKSKLPP
jgi:hypothetical protein